MSEFSNALSILRDECGRDQLGLVNSLDKFYNDAKGETSRMAGLYKAKAAEASELSDALTVKDQQIQGLIKQIAKLKQENEAILNAWSELNETINTEILIRSKLTKQSS